MKSLQEILNILGNQKYIHFSITNESSAWRGEWLVTFNMMDGKGWQYFHHYDFDLALKESLNFLKDYKSK
jgi:hypothetical protein